MWMKANGRQTDRTCVEAGLCEHKRASLQTGWSVQLQRREAEKHESVFDCLPAIWRASDSEIAWLPLSNMKSIAFAVALSAARVCYNVHSSLICARSQKSSSRATRTHTRTQRETHPWVCLSRHTRETHTWMCLSRHTRTQRETPRLSTPVHPIPVNIYTKAHTHNSRATRAHKRQQRDTHSRTHEHTNTRTHLQISHVHIHRDIHTNLRRFFCDWYSGSWFVDS